MPSAVMTNLGGATVTLFVCGSLRMHDPLKVHQESSKTDLRLVIDDLLFAI